LIAQEQRSILNCIPFDEFGEEIYPAQFERQCSQGIMDMLKLHDELAQRAYMREEEDFDIERLRLLGAARVAREEVYELLKTIEARVLYGVGIASLIAGIVALALGKADLAIITGTPFVIILVILLPIFYGIWRTRLERQSKVHGRSRTILRTGNYVG